MKVYAFKVEKSEDSANLSDVLSELDAQNDLRERIRIVNQTELRAEAIEFRNGVWFMDFVRIRTAHGPGKVGRDTEVEGFEFEDEEGFGEETAALYDPQTEYLLIQYNHFGVRPAAVADYLSSYVENANNLYTFKPKYDEDVERRLLNQGITRKINFSLDVSRMSAQDRERGASLSEAIDYGRRTGADRVKVEISVQGERHRGLGDSAREALTSLQAILGQNPDAVRKLEVAGKEDRDAVTEVLDLIGHRLSLEFNDLQLGGDLRYPRDERWRALERARAGWQRILN